MITNEGKNYIKRYLAGQVPSIARSIAFGIGGAAENVADTKLGFEAGRTNVTLVSYDFVTNKLIFKASVDETFDGKIYEAALYSTDAGTLSGEYPSKVITTFDADLEDWADVTSGNVSTFTATGARLGNDSLYHNQAASTTKSDALTALSLDLDGYSAADKFVFAFNVQNTATSSIRFQFHTDASNYYQFALGAQTVGYKIVEATKGSALVTGAPNWANITEIRVSSTSTAGGASQLGFDGIRIDDADTYDQDYVMVSRELLAAPFTKEEGKTQEIEFSLDVNV